MTVPTEFPPDLDATGFLKALMASGTTKEVEELLKKLPVVDANLYNYDEEQPAKNWVDNQYHWVPVGRDRGNAGRIRLAGKPIYPLAERLVNGMEALIELQRLRELKADPSSASPVSPREAVARYFKLPPLDQIPKSNAKVDDKPIRKYAQELSRLLQLKLDFDKSRREFAVSIHDQGMGQTGARMHRTLLSLGSSDKGDKPSLIGVFGQGGVVRPENWTGA